MTTETRALAPDDAITIGVLTLGQIRETMEWGIGCGDPTALYWCGVLRGPLDKIAELHAENARLRAELAGLRCGLDNHEEFSLPAPDAAEAPQVEERARIEAIAREQEERAKEEGRRDLFRAAYERWADSDSPLSRHDYLGITAEQWDRWSALGEIPEGWEPPADMQAEEIEFELV